MILTLIRSRSRTLALKAKSHPSARPGVLLKPSPAQKAQKTTRRGYSKSMFRALLLKGPTFFLVSQKRPDVHKIVLSIKLRPPPPPEKMSL